MGSAAIAGIAWSWAAFALGAGLSMVSRALMPKPDLGTQMGGRSVMTREAASSRKIIYGRARVGGNVVYLESTGTDNKYLWLVTAIAGHEIDAYEEVWFNDKKIWDGGSYVGNWGSYVSISFKDGSQTTADSGLVAASTKWTSDHKLLDTAYMVVKLTYDQEQFAQGLPNISTVVRGKKVLHPNNSSLVWSQNPALCLRDYLTDTKYGLGESTANIASINTAFGVCDEAVALAAGGTQPRYTMDGVVDTADSIKANIENMTGAMIGRLIYSGGKFEIHAGEYVAPTVTIDESMMVGEISVQTKQSRRNAYNGVKGVFLSEEDNYILADYPAQISSTYATQDGDPVYLDMPLPYTVNNIRAQRIAKLALFRSRQQEAITIPCNLNAFKFKIGDNINVSNTRLGYSSKVFEVVGYSFGFSSDQMVVNVEAIETASSIWDWTTSDEEVFLGAGEVDLYDGSFTERPASISVSPDSYMGEDGTFRPYFSVTWPASVDAFVDHYIVEWRTGSGDYLSQATKTSPFQITNLQDGASYNVRVKAVNGLGVQSLTRDATPTAATDTTAPSAPSSVSASGEFEQITINWTNPTVDDFSHVDVYRSTSSSGTYTLIGKSAGTNFTDTGLLLVNELPVQKFYKLRSVDYSGNATKDGSGNPVYSSIVNATTTQVPVGGIANDAVDTDQIADDAVDTGQIADEAVEINQIAATLQSTNYSSGSSGWKIQKSGAVEFEEATIRGEITATDLNVVNATVTGSFVANNLPNLQNMNGAVTADEINVSTLAAIEADLGAVTAGSLNNSTNSPTAGSAPTGVQSGTAINLSSGSFTFGNSSSFLYFNTSDGLVQGGLTPFNNTVSIYYQSSSAPSSPSDSSMTYSSTGSYSFTTNPPNGWALGIPSTTDNIYVVQADIGRIGAGLVTASWGQVSLFRAATVTGTSLATSPSSITFFYANSNSTTPNSYSNTYTVTASGAYSHAMVTNAVVTSGTWSSLNSGSVTVNEQSGDTGQFTVGSVTYQSTSFHKIWSWTVTHTSSGSTVSQSTRSLNPSTD